MFLAATLCIPFHGNFPLCENSVCILLISSERMGILYLNFVALIQVSIETFAQPLSFTQFFMIWRIFRNISKTKIVFSTIKKVSSQSKEVKQNTLMIDQNPDHNSWSLVSLKTRLFWTCFYNLLCYNYFLRFLALFFLEACHCKYFFI